MLSLPQDMFFFLSTFGSLSGNMIAIQVLGVLMCIALIGISVAAPALRPRILYRGHNDASVFGYTFGLSQAVKVITRMLMLPILQVSVRTAPQVWRRCQLVRARCADTDDRATLRRVCCGRSPASDRRASQATLCLWSTRRTISSARRARTLR